jgi:xanthine/CO dehydrogenase XdhC/CoxF family maturation factor
MKDIAALLAAAEHLHRHPDESVLVTLVHTRGSTYRRPGARMLVLPGCRIIGTISGGCLEPTVARQAWDATRNHQRIVLEIESAPEDDQWGPASGCHGTLYLLAEPIPPGTAHPALQLLAQLRDADQPVVLLHEFIRTPTGDLLPGPTRIEHAPHETTSRWLEQNRTATFRELLTPPPHLLICGAGDDAQPACRIAAELGWRIDVLDSRARLATRDRFPDAQRISAEGPSALPSLLRRHTAAVVMSHRFSDDVDYTAQLLQHNLPYIGLLGPRQRAQRLLAEVADRTNTTPSPDQLQRIFSPIGLDIGSATPESIALAIIAEIHAALAAGGGRNAAPLSHKVGPLTAEANNPCPNA